MRIAVLRAPRLPADELAEALRFAGHDSRACDRLPPPLPEDGWELLVAPAGLLAGHRPAAELATLRSGGTRVLAVAERNDEEALVALDPDDFVLDTCPGEEIALRVAVLERRARVAGAQLAAPPYEFHADSRMATLHGEPVRLTAREFELALYLFRRVGRRVSRDELAVHVWGTSPDTQSRTLDAHVSSLRKKLLLEPANGYRLCAHYGHGYSLDPVRAAA